MQRQIERDVMAAAKDAVNQAVSKVVGELPAPPRVFTGGLPKKMDVPAAHLKGTFWDNKRTAAIEFNRRNGCSDRVDDTKDAPASAPTQREKQLQRFAMG